MNRRLFLIGLVILLAGTILILLTNVKRGSGPASEPKNNKSVSLSNLLALVKESEAKGDFLQAKSIYQELISGFSNSSEVMNWQKSIEDINIKLLFSPGITPKSLSYEIKPGDTLTKIAREFKTTIDLIKKSNGLNSDKIVPGKKIKVWNTPFNLLVDKSQNTLILKSDEEIFKTYIVSTGTNNSTPVGNFKIVTKLENPTWFKAGAVVPPGSPENLLGTRWLGFNLAGYGIHGTNEPQSLGKQATQGCVRMANPEVEELYTIIAEGTEVTIVD